MKPSLSGTPSVLQRLAGAWRQVLFGIAVSAALLPGCGGGVGTGGTGSFTTSYSSGSITGLGSVIVNGVRYDDSQATLDDGDNQGRIKGALRLGMTVDIDSGPITPALTSGSPATATATRIRVASELLGPVESVDPDGFTVLGQRVAVIDGLTQLDGLSRGRADLVSGVTVQVYGLFDAATSSYRATRVDLASGQAPHLRAVVKSVGAGSTLTIGVVNYSYAGATDVPVNLAAGQYVRLAFAAPAPAGGPFVITAFGVAQRTPTEADDVKLKGRIGTIVPAETLMVNGRQIDVRGLTLPAGIAVGDFVEVEGALRNGVLRATELTVSTEAQEVEKGRDLFGTVTSVDAFAKTFVVRGQTVGTTRFVVDYSEGNASDLKVDAEVEVRGLLSADGRIVDAQRIKFKKKN